jgi:hypothetical protein
MTSKLFGGGGEGVNHSSVLPFHGSGPAIEPRLSDRATLRTVSRIPMPKTNEPIVEMRFSVARLPMSGYS